MRRRNAAPRGGFSVAVMQYYFYNWVVNARYDLFNGAVLPYEFIAVIERHNPWWAGKPGHEAGIYPFKRWPFRIIKKRLEDGLAPIVVIRGPRQVGKTVLQYQVIEELLRERVRPERILRIQFDELPSFSSTRFKEPIFRIIDWYEKNVLKSTLNEVARKGEPAYLFFDEVQNLPYWAPQLKSLVDNATVRVVATGSSALKIAAGHDSLAGRITHVDVGPLLLREVAELRGLGRIEPYVANNNWGVATDIDFWKGLVAFGRENRVSRDRAFAAFSDRGSYPIAQTKPAIEWAEMAAQLNDKIIKRVIEHDLRTGEAGRKRDPRLLEEVFTLSARYAGQAPKPSELAREVSRTLGADVGGPRIANYLGFLDSSLIVKLIPPLEIRLKKKQGPNKITICDHGLRASWLQEIIPLTPEALDQKPELTDLAGHLAENIAGYFLGSIPGIALSWFPKRTTEPELDFVITIGDRRIPVEVKYRRRIDAYRDTEALRTFIERTDYNAIFGVLVTRDDEGEVIDPRIICVPLSTLLLLR